MSLANSYFEQMYAENPDPWSLASRWYEQRKYAVTMASLTRDSYRRGFEPGCSVGVLTELLADRCDELLATDVVPDAVEAAQRRVRRRPSVDVRQMAVPDEWPDGAFDLIVISELGYYLSVSDLAALVEQAAGALSPDGELVAVHWRHTVPDYPLTGDQVQAVFRADPRLRSVASHQEDDFRLDVLAPVGARSVADREGLVR
jgi:SAM-dependent methyltransferase